MKNNFEELPCNIHPIEKEKGMNRLTKIFLILAFLTMLSMVLCNANAFIFFCSLADIVGIWAIAKSLHSDEWRV